MSRMESYCRLLSDPKIPSFQRWLMIYEFTADEKLKNAVKVPLPQSNRQGTTEKRHLRVKRVERHHKVKKNLMPKLE